MALKANRVGVAPTEVDSLGRIKTSSSDTYTKSEVDTLLNNKVSNSHLKANGKNFYFAYDAETDSYGYKLNGQGDFIPFNKATDKFLWNLSDTTGLTFGDNIDFLGGGYQEITNSDVQTITFSFKFKVKTDSTGSMKFISGFPHVYGSNSRDYYITDSNGEIGVGVDWNKLTIGTTGTTHYLNGNFTTDKTYYVSGVYRRG